MHPRKQFHRGLLSLAFEPGDAMGVAEFLKALIGSPTVRMDRASRINGLLNETVQAGSGSVSHSRQADSADASSILFRRDGDHRFARSIATRLGTQAADERFIYFDRSLEPVSS